MWSDNDIDSAFQRLAPAEPEATPFALDAWLRLETQLDKQVLERAVRRRVWQLLAAEMAVVALLALGWLLWPGSARPATAPAAAAETMAVALPGGQAIVPTGSPARPTPAARPTAASGPKSPTAIAPPQPLVWAAPSAPAALLAAVPTAPTRRLRPNNWQGAASQAAPLGAEWEVRPAGVRPRYRPAAMVPAAATETPNAGVPPTARATALPLAQPAPAAELQLPGASLATLMPRPMGLPPADLPGRPASLAAPAPTSTQPTAPEPTPARPARFWVGLVAAPDVSTVKLAGVQPPQANVGLLLEYRLGSRLRLSTGLLRATKRYVARRDDYDWGAYHARVYQRDFTEVEAACTVLDVPLNLRYDLLVRPGYLLFGSVGLSSFFMQRERYTYEYVDNNAPQYWERTAVNENQHLLRVLNVAGGYERRLGPHWSVQAEPYLKLPLAGVGLGKVQLASAGVFVAAKYGF